MDLPLPPMTRWQFYAEFGVQFALGIAFCLTMFWLARRDPKLQWRPSPSTNQLQEKLGFGLFFVAAIASYFSLRGVYVAFIEDASTDMAETIVESASEVIEGTYVAPDSHTLKEYLHGVIWGAPNAQQRETLLLMMAFWVTLGWAFYVFDFIPSPVNMFKKSLKAVAHVPLTALMVMLPMRFHRFDWNELRLPMLLAVVAAACIAASHTYNRKDPPPIPEMPETPK